MSDLKHRVATLFWTALIGLILTSFFWIGNAVFQLRLPETGHPAVFYSTETHDDLQLTFEKTIGDAKDSVLLFIYSLSDRRIQKALRKKAAEGVEVKVICDAQASQGIHRRLGPHAKIYLRKGMGLMHQKILVIDHRKIWIGSANLTPPSLKMHGNMIIGLDSRELAEMIEIKADAMTKTGKVNPVPESSFVVGGQPVEMWFLPDSANGVEKIRKLIKAAEKTIKVAMFTWTRHDFARDISGAMERGVAVEVVVDRNSAGNTSFKIVQELFENHLPVRISTGAGLLHHKLMIIDGKTLVCGSANWTYSAFTKNDDCFVVLHDLNEEQVSFLEKMWKNLLLETEHYTPAFTVN